MRNQTKSYVGAHDFNDMTYCIIAIFGFGMGFGILEVVSSFGRSLGYGLSFDSYIPKPETFGNALRGFDTHV